MRSNTKVTTVFPVRRLAAMLVPLLLGAAHAAQGSATEPPAARPAQPQAAALTLVLSGLKKQSGTIRIAIFDDPEMWLKKPAIAAVLPVSDGKTVYRHQDIPFGSYGVAVFHDANGNGQMDKTFLGLPKEAYGFSNNVRAAFGPPSWRKAVVAVEKPAVSLNIQLK